MSCDGPGRLCRDYWSNGRLAAEGRRVDGRQVGEWRYYNPYGSLREVIRFAAGREVVDWDAFFGRRRPPSR